MSFEVLLDKVRSVCDEYKTLQAELEKEEAVSRDEGTDHESEAEQLRKECSRISAEIEMLKKSVPEGELKKA